MKRDFDFIRKTLLDLEEIIVLNENGIEVIPQDGISYELFKEYIEILSREEFISVYSFSNPIKVKGLKWKGYELLSKIKNEDVWDIMKAQAKMNNFEISYDFINIMFERTCKAIPPITQ